MLNKLWPCATLVLILSLLPPANKECFTSCTLIWNTDKLQNGSDVSWVGFLSEEKAAEASPSTGRQKQLCLLQGDGRWLMREEGVKFCVAGGVYQPLGSVNPHLWQHTTPGTKFGTSSDFQNSSKLSGRRLKLILTGARWGVTSGAGGYERYFGLSPDMTHEEFWS